jgi:hypothetical protein
MTGTGMEPARDAYGTLLEVRVRHASAQYIRGTAHKFNLWTSCGPEFETRCDEASCFIIHSAADPVCSRIFPFPSSGSRQKEVTWSIFRAELRVMRRRRKMKTARRASIATIAPIIAPNITIVVARLETNGVIGTADADGVAPLAAALFGTAMEVVLEGAAIVLVVDVELGEGTPLPSVEVGMPRNWVDMGAVFGTTSGVFTLC